VHLLSQGLFPTSWCEGWVLWWGRGSHVEDAEEEEEEDTLSLLCRAADQREIGETKQREKADNNCVCVCRISAHIYNYVCVGKREEGREVKQSVGIYL